MWVMADSQPAGDGIAAGTGSAWGTPQAFDLLSAGETEIGHNFYEITIARIRGHVYMANNVAASNIVGLAAGIAFIPDTAMTAGDMPNPGNDNFDWIWHDFGHLDYAQRETLAAPLHAVLTPIATVDIDNKAMRKMNDNSSNLVIVFATTAVSATTPVVSFAIRTLVLLP